MCNCCSELTKRGERTNCFFFCRFVHKISQQDCEILYFIFIFYDVFALYSDNGVTTALAVVAFTPERNLFNYRPKPGMVLRILITATVKSGEPMCCMKGANSDGGVQGELTAVL
jgi:hypothetical protein